MIKDYEAAGKESWYISELILQARAKSEEEHLGSEL